MSTLSDDERFVEALVRLSRREVASKSTKCWDMSDLQYALGWHEDRITSTIDRLVEKDIIGAFVDGEVRKVYLPVRTYLAVRKKEKFSHLKIHIKNILTKAKTLKLKPNPILKKVLTVLGYGLLLNYSANVAFGWTFDCWTFPAYGFIFYVITIDFPDWINSFRKNKEIRTLEV